MQYFVYKSQWYFGYASFYKADLFHHGFCTGILRSASVTAVFKITAAWQKYKEMLNWLFRVLMTCSILCIITAIFCLVYSYKILPGNIYMLSVAIPLKSEVLLSYIRTVLSRYLYFHGLRNPNGVTGLLVVSLNKVANKFSSVNINIFKFKNFQSNTKKY